MNVPRASRFAVTLLFAFLATSLSAAEPEWKQSGSRVECYGFLEVTLRLPSPPSGNPFIDAELSGAFGGGNGPNIKVQGFCDSQDGSIFRVRFMPERPGRYEYSA